MSWTLRNKILGGYGLVLALLVVVLGWAFLNLTWLGGASEAILSENYESIRAADNMIGAIERQESGFLLYMLEFDEEGLEQFESNQPVFLRWLTRAEDNITIDAEREVIRRIELSYNDYVSRFYRVLREDVPMAIAVQDNMQPIFNDVREACEELRAINLDSMQSQSHRAQTISSRARWSVGGLGLLALSLGLLFSLLLSNRITRPARELSHATKELAGGNYDVRVPAKSKDELGELASQFNSMAAQLASFQELNVERIIAEKRKSEAIIHTISDGIIIVKPDLTIEHVNPAAEEALPSQKVRLRGKPIEEVLTHEGLLHLVRRVLADGSFAPEVPRSTNEEQTLETISNNNSQHYQYSVTPISGGNSEVGGALILLRDVTHFKEVDRLKSEFVATASHELKTPLTSIAMTISMLLESNESTFSDDDYELLRGAAEDTDRLRALIKDLLDLSSIEAGKIELDYAEVPISLVFDKTEQILGSQASEQDVDLSQDVDDDLPSMWGDASKITWVLTNLVSNALRYTKPGGSVRLSAEAIGSKIHISVQDDGAGIPSQYQSKIFEKFVQVRGDDASGGSGLGLAISREVVRAQGGSIWVDSAPGEGSTFTFTIPVAE